MSTPRESTLSVQSINSATESPASTSARAVDADNPPWGVVQALTAWLLSVGLLLIVPQICTLPYVASHYRGVGVTKAVLFADKTFILIYISGYVPAHLLTLALTWTISTRLGKFPAVRTLGLSWPVGFGAIKSAGLAIILFAATLYILHTFGGQETDLERILQSSRAAALITAFIAAATAPLVEEIIYRGLLYSAFQRVIGSALAVIAVSSMFAGLHVWQYWPNVAAISSITLLSVVLTITRARTGRLIPCYVIHLVFNGIQSLIIVFDPYLRALAEWWQHHASGLIALVIAFPR